MNDQFSGMVKTIKRLQAQPLNDPDLIKFVTFLAKMHNRSLEAALAAFKNADPVQLSNSYYAQLDAEHAGDAIKSARRGDRTHLEERADVRLTTQEEKPLLYGKKVMGRPPNDASRDLWIVGTIEALRATGLMKHIAIAKAGRAWGKHLYVTESTIEDIYKNNKLDAEKAEAMRDCFRDATESDVIDAINDYCRSQK